MKAQFLIYSIVGQGGICRLSSLRFASPAASVRGFAPMEKREFLQKFLQAFFKKPYLPNCSPFFSWCGSFFCVTTKKRSYSLCNYLLYLLSYYFTYCLHTHPRALSDCREADNHAALVPPFCVRSASVRALASDSARKSPACIFAGDFRSAKRIVDKRFNFKLNVCDEVGKPGRFTDSPK